MKAYKRAKCLAPYCANTSHCRGLCRNHYNQATMAVRFNQTTWEELIKHGKCDGLVQPRRKNNWVMDFKKGKHDS